MIGGRLSLAGRARLTALALPAAQRQAMGTSRGGMKACSSASNAQERGREDHQIGSGGSGGGSIESQNIEFSVLSETVVHRRYLTLYNRAVQFPSIDGSTRVCGSNKMSPVLHEGRRHMLTAAAAPVAVIEQPSSRAQTGSPGCAAGPRARI